MWNYEKRLQYPINIKEPNAKIAQIIMSQYGGPDSYNRWVLNKEDRGIPGLPAGVLIFCSFFQKTTHCTFFS